MPDIVIKKVKKGGHGGHHGGSWKVAYADFVTAMMAFFLLLWLLSSASQQQLQGISNYFAPESISMSESGSGGILGGTSLADEGSLKSAFGTPTISMEIPPPQSEEAAAAQKQAQKESQEFKKAAQQLDKAMQSSPELKDLAKNLQVEETKDGLRIQILDKDGTSMFPSGSSDLKDHTKLLLAQVAKAIKDMPQQISIEGHTDSVPYSSGNDTYTNWELSADRALSTRRELQHDGLPDDRFGKVAGLADTDPLLPDDPKNERNRRISITLLRGTGVKPTASGTSGNGTSNQALPNGDAATGNAGNDRNPNEPIRRPTFSVPSRD
jgi:chemotaxis protein MotB